ncbi:hypothetical protein RKD19_006491 [Streptomyces canus]
MTTTTSPRVAMRWASYELPAPVVRPPPCSHTTTGRGRAGRAPSGVVTPRWRQSSSVLPPGTSPACCGQALAGRVASRTPDQGAGRRGGAQRSRPTGGAA